MIHVSNLGKIYVQESNRLQILKNLSFNVEKGKTISILGHSGSGKSTLLSLLVGLDSPTEGTVEINQENITNMNEEDLARFRAKHIGFVFQQFHLIAHLTAEENVTLPLEILNPNASRSELKIYVQQAKEMLKSVGLENRNRHFPHQLSGGECQRVAIARALIHKPFLLLADEPSGNLDQKTGEGVMRLLFESVRERQMTFVLVTHNEELAKHCDQIYDLKEGVLIRRGIA